MTQMNDILDSTLDDLADLPETKPFPAGVHVATMFLSLPVPKAGKRQTVMCKFKHKETKELVNPTATAPNPDDEALIFISLYTKEGGPNEIGQGQLKALLKPLQAAGLSGNTRELIEATKPGVDVVIVTGEKEYNGMAQMTFSKIDLA